MQEWIVSHLFESIVGLFIAGSAILQISPIKINPWSSLAAFIGKAVNKELIAKIELIDRKVEQQRLDTAGRFSLEDERYAKQCRMRILRFNDEILQGRPHTKEHYDETLDDITEYERYCETHPGYRNSRAVMAIDNVESSYQKHLANKDFL